MTTAYNVLDEVPDFAYLKTPDAFLRQAGFHEDAILTTQQHDGHIRNLQMPELAYKPYSSIHRKHLFSRKSPPMLPGLDHVSPKTAFAAMMRDSPEDFSPVTPPNSLSPKTPPDNASPYMNYESELLPFGDDFIFFNLETQPHEQFGPYSDQPLHFDGGSLGLLDPFHDPLHNSKDELSLSIGMPGSNFHLPQPGPVQLQLNPSQATLPPLPAEIFTLYDNQTTPSPPSSASQTPPSELERHISPPRVPDNRPSHFPRLSRTAATSSSSRPAPTRSRVKKPKAVRSKANGLIRCLCPTCPQTFSRTSDMDRHIKTGIHPDIGPGISLHICPSCQKGFGRKDSRDRHIAKQACNKRAEPCTSRVRHLPRPKAGDPFSSKGKNL